MSPSAYGQDTRPCPAPGCPQRCRPDRLACRGHWYQLPKGIRDRIWANYVPGQTAFTVTAGYKVALRDAEAYWASKAKP